MSGGAAGLTALAVRSRSLDAWGYRHAGSDGSRLGLELVEEASFELQPEEDEDVST